MKPAKITVFCSSANLGPGFDTLGLGLSIPLTCILDYPTQKTTISTDNNEITTDLKHNLISKTVQFVGNVYRKNLPFYELKIKSEIPLSRGLGSSASAIVLGILVASKILSLELSNQQITDLGTVIEGHPDNVSASVYGNLTVSFLTKPLPPFQEEWFEEGSRCEGVEELIGNLTRTTVVEVNKAIRVTAVIPDFELGTFIFLLYYYPSSCFFV